MTLSKRRTTAATCLLLLTGLLLSGCVERRLTIHTEPEGALVVLNDEEIGLSPVTVPFNWYGDYSVRISKNGYETLVTHRELKRPWYDHFPFDFFAQILNPNRIVDEYEWKFVLKPKQPTSREELLRRSEALKQQLE